MIVFDTNVLINYMKGSPAAQSALNGAVAASISRITWIEIMAGFDHGDALLMQENTVMLAMFDVIEIDAKVSSLGAAILAEHRIDRLAKKQNVPKFRPPDAIIHATAMLYATKLVTSNVDDFKAVRCHKQVLVERPI